MKDADIHKMARTKIADGTLPRDRIGRVLARYGANEVCDVCTGPVSPGGVLYTLERAERQSFVFHGECFVIWRNERSSMTSVGPAVLD